MKWLLIMWSEIGGKCSSWHSVTKTENGIMQVKKIVAIQKDREGEQASERKKEIKRER